MPLGIIGKKLGMTRLYDEDGTAHAVTVIDIAGNEFVQIKSTESDGYTAVQIGFDDQKESRLNKPQNGHFAKHGSGPKRRVQEFRLDSDAELPEAGSKHPGAELFQVGQWIDVIGTSKGKGFQGVMKRYNFGGQRMTHGSMMHRRPGAIAAGSTPGRVWKNQKMPGHHGTFRRTVQNLKVLAIRPEDGVILVSGAVPGAKGGYLVIRPAKKKSLPQPAAE
ncbi:MAG: 50S ribosomal protein L3 [Verrucomicrobiales bacterium]